MSLNLAFAVVRRRSEPSGNCSKFSLPALFHADGWIFTAVFIAVLIMAAQPALAVAPVADDQPGVVTNEDTPVGIILTGSDFENDPLIFFVQGGPSNGSLSGSAPNLTYTPNINFNGADSFTFNILAGGELSNLATVSITVAPQNDPPIANNNAIATNEDVPVAVTLTGSDVDGDGLTFGVVATPTNGVLTGTAPNLTYTPNLNFSGGDSFTYIANDGTLNSNVATFSITVNSQNDAPTATQISNQSASEGVLFNLDASGNFDDVDGDTLTYTSTGLPASLAPIGFFSGIINGTPTQAEAEFNGGIYNVTVTATDPSNASAQSSFTVTVGAVNDVPVANSQNVSTNEDTALPIVLNATDGDGDSLTYSIVSGPTNGVLSGTAPSVTYTPNLDFNGPDSFTFQANDGTVNSNIATVSITVNPLNDAPTTTPISNQSASEGLPYNFNVTGNFDDVDGDALIYTATGLPASLSPIDPNLGIIDGTPTLAEAQFNGGVYNIVVTARDPSNESVDSPFVLTVGIVNDAPIADPQVLVTDEDSSLPIELTGSDADGDTITFALGAPPANGTLVGTAPNLTYTPNLNFNGTDSFSFTVNDGTVSSAPAVVSITVDPVNDLPLLVTPIDDQQAVEAALFSLNVAGNFADPDNESLTFSAIGLPASLGPIDPATGVITGTPTQVEAQFNGGVYNVTVTATDGTGESASDIFQLLVVELSRANVMLSVTASPTPAMLNDQIQFSFLVRNNGPALATNLELDGSFVGSGLTVTPSGATTCTVQAPANQVTDFNCTVENLNVLASTSVTLLVTGDSPGAVTLAATAAASTPTPIDPDLADNSASLAVGVAEFFSNGAVDILGDAQILAVAHGDLNNDGATDIVLGTIAGLPAQVFLNDGFRGFSAQAISIPDSSAQQGVAISDFDGDGILDVVLANANVDDRIYRNDGTGAGFTLWSTLPSGAPSNDVVAADFDLDGNMDVLIAANGGNPLFLGDGSGVFTLDSTLGNANSSAVAVGQLTGNSRLDAVFANIGSGSTVWSDIGFSANNNASRTFNFGDASSVVIAELIGSSNTDALDVAFGRIPTIVGEDPGNPIWSNDGSGGLSLNQTLGSSPTNDVLAGDVNRDGQNDLVFVNGTGVHQIWTRSGNTFELHSEQIVADSALSGIVADLGFTDENEPGGVDLAMGGNPTGGAGIFLNDGFGNLGKGDITAPTMTLNGNDPMEVASRTTFNDPGVQAIDNIDGDISSSVVATGVVNTALVGSYTVTYNITDFAGNPAPTITRTVNVTPSSGTGGGGGTMSWFAVWFLISMIAVSSACRHLYISMLTSKND